MRNALAIAAFPIRATTHVTTGAVLLSLQSQGLHAVLHLAVCATYGKEYAYMLLSEYFYFLFIALSEMQAISLDFRVLLPS